MVVAARAFISYACGRARSPSESTGCESRCQLRRVQLRLSRLSIWLLVRFCFKSIINVTGTGLVTVIRHYTCSHTWLLISSAVAAMVTGVTYHVTQHRQAHWDVPVSDRCVPIPAWKRY
jgi:hypothetical protein